MLQGLAKAIIMLMIAIDPIGNAPIFYAATISINPKRRRRIILRSIEVAAVILVAFALLGDFIFEYFGITVNDFKVAGGIILLIYGIAGIMGFTEAGAIRAESEESLAIVPLATPLLAGPAAIATTLYLKSMYGLVPTMIAIGVNIAVTLLLLVHSDVMLRVLGRSGGIALAKIMSLILTAIAVAMIREGIIGIVSTTS